MRKLETFPTRCLESKFYNSPFLNIRYIFLCLPYPSRDKQKSGACAPHKIRSFRQVFWSTIAAICLIVTFENTEESPFWSMVTMNFEKGSRMRMLKYAF